MPIPAGVGTHLQLFAFGFQKNSPYLGLFNYYLKKMDEKGATHKILASYKVPDQQCPDYKGKALGFNSCITAFIVIFCGLFVALAMFAAEQVTRCMNISMPTYDTLIPKTAQPHLATHMAAEIDELKRDKEEIQKRIEDLQNKLDSISEYHWAKKYCN